MNFDITFCLSDSCPRSKLCGRNFTTLKNNGILFNRPISMATFYNENKFCEYYIKLEN